MTARRISFTGPWNAERLAARFVEAAIALKTASVGRNHPLEKWTTWPAVPVHKTEEAYGYTEVQQRPPRASPAAISRMDEMLALSAHHLSADRCAKAGLPPDAQVVVWLRASNTSFARIGLLRRERWHGIVKRPPGGNSRPSLVAIEIKTLRHLANELNLALVPYREAEVEVMPPLPQAPEAAASNAG